MGKINFKSFFVKPKLPSKLKPLYELAMNVWSTWDKDTVRLFSRIDPILFRKWHHNPVKLLHVVSTERLEELAKENGFLYEMESVYNKFKGYIDFEGHYYDNEDNEKNFPNDFKVAYFSMEFGMHESLPIYSGGLGILSGDHLKSASDLALPLYGIGLLYKYGYFSQQINHDYMQTEVYHENDWYSTAIKKIKDDNGVDRIFKVQIKHEDIYFKVWVTDVGKVPLYLIDTNIEENSAYNQKITDYLYVADRNLRLLQEILLAFGGIELCKQLNIEPSVYHLNEGHSALIVLKRIQNFVKQGFSIAEAREFIRASTVFTTHTPVPAGNEQFSKQMIHHFLADAIAETGLNFEEFCQYGYVKGSENFWLPALAIRFSNYINGVSKLHSDVSQSMWHCLYPSLYKKEIPIQAITNGVHIHTWLAKQLSALFDRYIGPAYLHMAEEKSVWQNIFSIPDEGIWKAHLNRKTQMIGFIRQRMENSYLSKGFSGHSGYDVSKLLKPDVLTIGFARRFAPYKRSNLILNNPKRLLQLLNNQKRPVQFVFAGKAHPADEKGKAIIKSILDFAKENHVEDKLVFVEDYDINTARHLVQGVDVWLNNPIKPLEASGTSGMKAGMNGVLNLSVLDGWWPECFNGKNGWAITAGEGIEDPDLRDRLEASQIYSIIEKEIIPKYYKRLEDNIPQEWVEMMKNSIYDVGLGFNTHRMLRDYINMFYIPAFKFTKLLEKDESMLLKKIIASEKDIKQYWDRICIIDCIVEEKQEIIQGDKIEVVAKIKIEDAPVELFNVEIFYLFDTDKFTTSSMEFIGMENKVTAIYKALLELKESGQQSFNIRIKPKACPEIDRFCDFSKWFY